MNNDKISVIDAVVKAVNEDMRDEATATEWRNGEEFHYILDDESIAVARMKPDGYVSVNVIYCRNLNVR